MMHQKPSERRRQIPSVDRILRHASMEPICKQHGRVRVRDWVRMVLDQLRQSNALNNGEEINGGLLNEITEQIVDLARAEARTGVRRVINGTGVILQTNLGRAPLAQDAIDAMNAAARSCNVEFDLETGHRGRRGATVESLLCELTGAEAALVVNNCAAATLLTLRALAAGHEVVISRGQLIEIGGSYRLPDAFAEAGVILREVGTTNRTHLADYQQAFGENTRAILRVHASNFLQSGFTRSVSTKELAPLAQAHSLPLIDDIGSGCFYDLSPYGWAEEPTIGGSLSAGADVVLFSGDKLFGGPQCGMILGREGLIEQIRRSSLTRALRIDKLTVAALEATLRIYLSGRAWEEIPVLQAIAQPVAALRERAEQLRSQLSETVANVCVDVEILESVPGGGSLPGETLPSCGLVLRVPDCDETARRLRVGLPPIITRVHQNAVCIDLRSVAPDEDAMLLDALERTLAVGQGAA